MQYKNIVPASFIIRPNRFIAHCALKGDTVSAHVRNTGRCAELLLPDVPLGIEISTNPLRKTGYSLISVMKGERWVNLDSTAPNKVFKEALQGNPSLLADFGEISLIRPETVFGSSRFDFYLEAGDRKAFVEVKGVTLEENGVALFPDAPTERGLKHIEELVRAKQAGYEAYIVFIVQMEGVNYFSPHARMHPDFSQSLKKAGELGVRVLCFDCEVGIDAITLDSPVLVVLP